MDIKGGRGPLYAFIEFDDSRWGLGILSSAFRIQTDVKSYCNSFSETPKTLCADVMDTTTMAAACEWSSPRAQDRVVAAEDGRENSWISHSGKKPLWPSSKSDRTDQQPPQYLACSFTQPFCLPVCLPGTLTFLIRRCNKTAALSVKCAFVMQLWMKEG